MELDIEKLVSYSTEDAIAEGIYKEKGRKYVLFVKTTADLDRNIYKSESTYLEVPDIQLEVPCGLSRYTTVKSLLEEIGNNLQNSSVASGGEHFNRFMTYLDEMKSGKRFFTLILDDPLGLVWIESLSTANGDKNLKIEDYERSSYQCMDYGIKMNSKSDTKDWKEGSPIHQLSNLINKSSKIVVLSGAGVSVESGIPAFRAAPGSDLTNIWDQYDMKCATKDHLDKNEAARIEYWSMHTNLHEFVLKAKPNASHNFVVYLNTIGKLSCLVTQNIDKLYQKAGLPQDKLIELHGNEENIYCPKCGKDGDRELVHNQLKTNQIKVPTCAHCNELLKLGTISFGEAIPVGWLNKAIKYVQGCDLLIVMGTSLVVQPANKFPQYALDAGVPVCLINLGETKFDDYVDVLISEKCGVASQKVIDENVLSTCKEEDIARNAYYWTQLRQK